MDLDDEINTLDFIDSMNKLGGDPIVQLSQRDRDSLLFSGKTYADVKSSGDDEG